MRQAKKLGLLGLAALALVAALGLVAGVGGTATVFAQPALNKTCTPTAPATTFAAGSTFTCTENLGLGGTSSTVVVAGGVLTNYVLTTLTPTGTAGTCAPATVIGPGANTQTVACTVGAVGNFFTGLTETITIPAAAAPGTALTQTVSCTSTAAAVAGTPGACGGAAGGVVGPVAVTATSTLTGTPVVVGAAAAVGAAGPPAAKTCSGPGGAAPLAGQTDTCAVTVASSAIPAGGSLQVTVPTGATLTSCTATAPLTAAASGNTCVFTSAAGAAIGASAGSETFIVSPTAVNGTALTQTGTTCTSSVVPCPVAVTGSTVGATIIATGTGAFVGPSAAGTGVCGTTPGGTATVLCTNLLTAAIVAGQSVTTTITAPPGATITLLAPATSGTTLTVGTCVLTTGLPTLATSASAAVTWTCQPGQSAPAGTNVAVAVSCTTLTGVPCTPTEVTTITVGPPVNQGDPTSEVKYCNNTSSTGLLSQSVGGFSQTLGVTGPATSFTLPLFGPASTCILQPQRLVGATATNCLAGTVACADGYFQLTLSTPGSGAAISCATTFTGTAPITVATNNGGACTPQVQGTQLNIPCGVTAGTAAASTTVSATCTNVLFDISSVLGACVNTPSFCVNPGTIGNTGTLGLNVGNATVTVVFFATPANGGQAAGIPFGGGIQLGQNTFSFAGPGIGTLLVAASPQLIPSNGTEASVVSATFACTTGFTSIGGFPLSNTATSANAVLSIGASGQIVVNGNGSCGAGLPGTFTFATPGPVLFDNGRSTESISCGPNANVNAFGNGSAFFGTLGSTFPLAFTCTGAAVLAIGAGVAGDAPINVTYTSAVGGLQAVGSTLLTVSPAGIPRISVACNPSSISAGNTGSLCTATVTDINGVPLSGISGATVTFTTSDNSTTTILPCTIGTPGAINVTTSPAVIPLVTPQAPCVTPSSVIPGQVNTFLNGQATALLVASSTAHPEVVTVTASLGVLIPPSFACLVAPYVSSGGFGAVNAGTQPGYYAPYSGTGVYGCGSTTPIGTSGLSTALNVAGGGLTGIVTLPNQTSASTTVTIGGPAGIQVAGATAISPIVLSRGCNNVIITAPVGTPVANIAALVSPQNSVVSIWRFNNGTKLFNAGFFSDPNAPTDFALTGSLSGTTAPNQSNTVISGQTYNILNGAALNGAVSGIPTLLTESYYICINQQATMISG